MKLWSKNKLSLKITHADVVESDAVLCKVGGQEEGSVYFLCDGPTETEKVGDVFDVALLFHPMLILSYKQEVPTHHRSLVQSPVSCRVLGHYNFDFVFVRLAIMSLVTITFVTPTATSLKQSPIGKIMF